MTEQSGVVNALCKGLPITRMLSGLLVCVAVIFSGVPLTAQVESGINGTVMDSGGALIAGAVVTATNDATGVVSRSVTSSAGTFVFVGLIPGHYSVAVEAPGFKRSLHSGVIVEIGKMTGVGIQLDLGATSSTIRVAASAISLDTTSPVLGTTVEPELVESAPLEINGLARQIDSFVLLAPGVTATGPATNTIGGPAGIAVNGGVSYESAVQFNGVPVAFVDYSGNQTNINPPYEMVNEFRVSSSTFDAAYGLGKAVVTYSMASGTNHVHGDTFEILRNQLFDSKGFFPSAFNANGNPVAPVDQQNNYGVTLGGPVYIPKAYNGKDRTFFHFSSDWFRQNQAQNTIGTVPTVAMKNGDFSDFVDSSGALIPIYDPQTGQPFPGNIIPKTRFSPLSMSILSQIPNPDLPGVVDGLESNKLPAVRSVAISQFLWGYTIDETISSSQSVHFSQWRDSLSSPFFTAAPIVSPTNELQSEVSNSQLGSGFLLNYTKTISQNLVMTAGANWIGSITGQRNAKAGVSFGGTPGGSTFPLVNFDGQHAPTSWGPSGATYFGCCEGGLTVSDIRRLGVVFANNWIWNKGKHTFTFGGEFRHTFEDILPCNSCSGTFNFSARTTSTPNSNDPNFGADGSSFASFLLGEVDAGGIVLANEQRLRSKEFAPYAQDNIKLNHRLTASVGLRWDVMVPFTDDSNQIIYLNPTEANPGAGNLPGAATMFGNCADCSGITRASIHWKHIQPRLGFSYALNSLTELQSGFYLTMLDGGAYEYGTSQVAAQMSPLLDGEYNQNSNGSSTPGYGEWDANPMPRPKGTPFSPSIANGVTIFTFYPKQAGMAPFDQAWNVKIERQLPWNMFLTTSYVGGRTVHLPTTNELPNQPNPSVLQYGSLLAEPVTSPDAVAAGIKIPYPGFVQQLGGSATVEQALSPFPQFSAVYPVYELDGTSFYSAFQAQAEKRFSNNLSYLADVTIGENKANCVTGSTQYAFNGENAYNPRPEFSRSYLDQKYITRFVWTYKLPIGMQQKYLNSRRPLAQVLGGWQFSGIMTYAGGYPMGAYNSYNPLEVNFFDRPNVVPGVRMHTFNYGLSKAFFKGRAAVAPLQFTTNAFANTGPWALGDALRTYSALRTPPLREENAEVIKALYITERVHASLRLSYFNAFNRTQLEEPDDNSLDSTFGQIVNLGSQISNRQGQATFRLEF